MPQSRERIVVLLRGINVGGRHSVPMAELRSLLADELCCTGVATYIQSGNAVCTVLPELRSGAIAKALAHRFGFPIPVALRTLSEFNAIVAANPFTAGQNADIASLHAVFFEAPPSSAFIKALTAKCAGEEQLAVHERELFLHLPHGAGRSKLAFAVTVPAPPGKPTMRNRKTVLQLHKMLED